MTSDPSHPLKQVPAPLPRDDKQLLRDLAAAPRPTGSDAIAAARARVARELRALGFDVRERPFEFSAFPGRYATPLFGGATALIVGVAGHWGAAGQRWVPVLVSALGALAMLLAGRWLARQGVLALPLLREPGINLEATLKDAEVPRIWLCAHIDSKSQPVPTLVRGAGIVLAGLGFAATVVLALIAAAGTTAHTFYWGAAALLTLTGATPVVLSVVGTHSPGALDNASGVAAVIHAAGMLGPRSVGVLITDAEEMGLAGARAWARSARRDAVVLNCDGVDDDGGNVVMYSGRRPERLLRAVADASDAGDTGIPHRTRRIPLGMLTDSLAFANAQLASVTFSRGSWSSLARVHSRSDDLTHLRGTGIAQMAGLIGGTVRNLGGVR